MAADCRPRPSKAKGKAPASGAREFTFLTRTPLPSRRSLDASDARDPALAPPRTWCKQTSSLRPTLW